jgi:hypothetical protein
MLWLNNMKKAHIVSFFLLSLVVLPSVLVAQVPPNATDPGGLIVCDGVAHDGIPACGYPALIELGKRIIDALVKYSTLLVVVLSIVAGFRLLTSGGDVGARKKAKDMMIAVLTGYAVILIAWLVVYTILKVLIDPDQFSSYTILGNPNP